MKPSVIVYVALLTTVLFSLPTVSSPPTTIQQLINNASGNTLTVPAGTYNETAILNRSLTFIGYNVTWTSNDQDALTVTASHTVIEGFTFTGNDWSIRVQNCHNVTIHYCTFTGNAGAVNVEASASNVTVHGCTATAGIWGVNLEGANCKVLENNFDGNTIAVRAWFNTHTVYHNNFVRSEQSHAQQHVAVVNWTGNYWDNNTLDPHPLLGSYVRVGHAYVVHEQPVTLQFTNVTTAGLMYATPVPSPPVPVGYEMAANTTAYNVSVTAAFTGNVSMQVGYLDAGLLTYEEQHMALATWNVTSQSWTIITVTRNFEDNLVTGSTTHFSLFATFYRLVADINLDGYVDIYDAILLAGDFGWVGECASDLNVDGVVDIYDAVILASQFE